MEIKRILCPIDFSEFNQAANQHASILAQSTGAKIIYLHVSLPDAYRTPAEMVDTEAEDRHLLDELEKIKPTQPNVEASYVVEHGIAADRIIHFANQNDIDLIVMGTHGRTGLVRVLVGSVAETVIRHAPCPVMAIKTHPDPTSPT